jgi:SAM-dependent methyltransferase
MKGSIREVRRAGPGGDSPTLWDHAWHDVDLDHEIARYARGRDAIIQLLTEAMPREGFVLEAGCGSGRAVAWLGSKSRDAIGLDFAAEALAEARARDGLPMVVAQNP